MARLFGLEIEFKGDKGAVVAALNAAGVPCEDWSRRYDGHSTDKWVVKYDGSVNDGGELVSPPLDFDDPAVRQQVTDAVKAMQVAGAKPDHQAGIHVHVDARDLTERQVACVTRSFTKFEDVLYRIATSGWRSFRSGGYQYAKPLPQQMVDSLAKVRTRDALMKAWYGRVCDPNHLGHYDNSRYHGVNLHSYFQRGTIEFRLFNSSVNPKRVQCYIAICVALVEDSRRGKMRSVNKAYRLGDMHEGKANPDNALHRFLQVLRYEASMSAEDMKLVRYCWKDSQPQPARGR